MPARRVNKKKLKPKNDLLSWYDQGNSQLKQFCGRKAVYGGKDL